MLRYVVVFKYIGEDESYRETFHTKTFDWSIFRANNIHHAREKFLNKEFLFTNGPVRDEKENFKILDIKKFSSFEEEEDFKSKYWNGELNEMYGFFGLRNTEEVEELR